MTKRLDLGTELLNTLEQTNDKLVWSVVEKIFCQTKIRQEDAIKFFCKCYESRKWDGLFRLIHILAEKRIEILELFWRWSKPVDGQAGNGNFDSNFQLALSLLANLMSPCHSHPTHTDFRKANLIDRWSAKFFEWLRNDNVDTMRFFLKAAAERQKKGLKKFIENNLKSIWAEPLSVKMIRILYPFTPCYLVPKNTQRCQKIAVLAYNDFKSCRNRNMERTNAEDEAKSMRRALRESGFQIKELRNWKKAKDMMKEVEQIANDHKETCCVFLTCIMTHGSQGILYGGEDDENSAEDINSLLYSLEERLNAHERSAIGLPKEIPRVVFIQACQGKNQHKRSQYSKDQLKDAEKTIGEKFVTVQKANFLVFMSTTYGYDSNRNHFIPHLAENIRNAKKNESLQIICTKTSRDMEDHPDDEYNSQVPISHCTLRRDLLLNY